MLLVGKIDFKNNDIEDGYKGSYSIKFELPRRLRRRAKLKLRYFAFLKSHYKDDKILETFDTNTGTGLQYLYRYNPDAIRMRIMGNGEDLLGDNATLEYTRLDDNGAVNVKSLNYITFNRSIGTIAAESTLGTNYANDEINIGRFAWTNCGHNSWYDMNIGEVEEHISEIECLFEIMRDKNGDYSGLAQTVFSGEDKIRMSSITLKLELIE